MFIITIFRFLCGYVTLRVSGVRCERFLNLLARRGVDFWRVHRDGGSIILNIPVSAFRRLGPTAREAYCRVHIVKKNGLPFFIAAHKKRWSFAAGFLMFLGMIAFLSQFIWSIDIVNDTDIPSADIERALSRYGLYEGARISDIDTAFIRDSVMTYDERVAYIGINIAGTGASVEVKQRVPAPHLESEDGPRNIVASCSGHIRRMEVLHGEPAVKEGEAVLSGQLLISGLMDSKVEGARPVRADGSVWATTWHEISVTVPLTERVTVDTGRRVSFYTLRLFNIFIKINQNSSIEYEKYDKMTSQEKLVLFGRTMPAAIITETCSEQGEAEFTIDEAAALRRAQEQCDVKLARRFPDAVIIGVERETTTDDRGVTVRAVYECEENIARSEPIDAEGYENNSYGESFDG